MQYTKANDEIKIRRRWNFEINVKINHQKPKSKNKIIFKVIKVINFQ